MNKKIVVLMTGPLLTEQPGGIQTHVQNFIGAFSMSSSIDFRFLPVTLGLFDKEGWVTKAWRFVSSLRPFGRAVLAADVVHINSTFDNRSLIRDGLYVLIARRLLGKPVVLQFHGGLPTQVGLTRSGIMAGIFEAILKNASRILILSRIQGNEFLKLYPRLSYDLVPNYTDCGQGAARKTATQMPMRFLFMGRLHENKGIKEIVAASHILASKELGFIVEFCGDGPLKVWLENEIAKLPTGHLYLAYNGTVSGEKKVMALIGADVMLLPSTHNEGFPYALLEASKYGMPMIATRVGAIPDVITSGENGLLISARDALALTEQMEFAIRNPLAIQAMGVRARQQVEAEFSIEKLKLTFEELYTVTAGAQ